MMKIMMMLMMLLQLLTVVLAAHLLSSVRRTNPPAKFQCPTCHGRKGNEKSGQANCDGKARMVTCTQENPMCEAVSYDHGTFLRQCTNKMYHGYVEDNCKTYGNCKTATCTESQCRALIS